MACQAAQFIDSLFLPDEHFELITMVHDDGGRKRPVRSRENMWMQTSEFTDETFDILKELIQKTPDGAWISLNPLRSEIVGKAPGDADVTSCRYTLIEADELTKEEQWAKIRELNLPIKSVVWSGGKSLHVIVKIEAGTDRQLYDTRVKALHDYLDKQQFPYDRANKNPSRLTRLPGVRRGDDKQYLVAGEFGPKTWEDFERFFLRKAKDTDSSRASQAVDNNSEFTEDVRVLTERYGEPFYPDKNGNPSTINQDFFAVYTIRK